MIRKLETQTPVKVSTNVKRKSRTEPNRTESNQIKSRSKAPVRFGLHLTHLLLMQLHHTALSHTTVPESLRAGLMDPLLLPAVALAALLIHQ